MLSLELALPASRFDFGQMRSALEAHHAAAAETAETDETDEARGEPSVLAAVEFEHDAAGGVGGGAGGEGARMGSVQADVPPAAATPSVGAGAGAAQTAAAAPSPAAISGVAIDGDVSAHSAPAPDTPPAPPPRALFALLPLSAMLLATPLGMWLDGRSNAEGPSLIDAFAAADSTAALTWATGLGNLLAFALPLCSRQPLGSLIESWVRHARRLSAHAPPTTRHEPWGTRPP